MTCRAHSTVSTTINHSEEYVIKTILNMKSETRFPTKGSVMFLQRKKFSITSINGYVLTHCGINESSDFYYSICVLTGC